MERMSPIKAVIVMKKLGMAGLLSAGQDLGAVERRLSGLKYPIKVSTYIWLSYCAKGIQCPTKQEDVVHPC